MMPSGIELLSLLLATTFARVVGEMVFTDLPSSQVSWVPTRMSYSRAASNCARNGASLLEMWNEQEWKEVRDE